MTGLKYLCEYPTEPMARQVGGAFRFVYTRVSRDTPFFASSRPPAAQIVLIHDTADGMLHLAVDPPFTVTDLVVEIETRFVFST
jgi:hypothetical protein